METKIFKDKKIIIRRLSASDLNWPEKFQKFINSFVQEDAMLLTNTKKSKKDESKWLASRIKEVKQHKTVYLLAESNNEIIGSCSVSILKERKSHIGELGIAIKQGFRGMGIGRYLMTTLIKMAKTELKPKPKIIELSVFENNKPAIALYKKMGFKTAAKIPNHLQYKSNLVSEIIMQLKV